jgi:hypothetical protein
MRRAARTALVGQPGRDLRGDGRADRALGRRRGDHRPPRLGVTVSASSSGMPARLSRDRSQAILARRRPSNAATAPAASGHRSTGRCRCGAPRRVHAATRPPVVEPAGRETPAAPTPAGVSCTPTSRTASRSPAWSPRPWHSHPSPQQPVRAAPASHALQSPRRSVLIESTHGVVEREGAGFALRPDDPAGAGEAGQVAGCAAGHDGPVVGGRRRPGTSAVRTTNVPVRSPIRALTAPARGR